MVGLSTRVQQVQETLLRLSCGLLSTSTHQAAIEAERDAYRTSLYALTRKDVPVRPEEFVPGPAEAPSLAQFILDLEREPSQ
jgi:hypothetical protein